MKKTLTLLFAATSIAMGADDYKIVIDNSQGTASTQTALNNSKHQTTVVNGENTLTLLTATVAVTLNLSKMDVDANTPIFTIQGTHSSNGTNVLYGVGIEKASFGDCLDTWYGTQPDYQTQTLTLSKTEIENASYGVVVFTIAHDTTSNYSTLSELLFLYDEDGNLMNDGKAYPGTTSNGKRKRTYFADFDYINITSDLVYGAEVYGTVFDDKQLYDLADGMMKVCMGNSNIPEPTTATLSLLALAGLAARRRR